LEAVMQTLLDPESRADKAVAETRVALSEAQSTMIKLERAIAVWTQYELALTEYEVRETGRLLGTEEVFFIDPQGRLFTGRLLPALLSASQAWLLGVAVMAAIAARAKAPILVLDGADILDDRNKITLIKWVLAEICPHFSHTLLLSTAR
jgi:hypothetical protein